MNIKTSELDKLQLNLIPVIHKREPSMIFLDFIFRP